MNVALFENPRVKKIAFPLQWTDDRQDAFLAFTALFQFVVLMVQLFVLHLFRLSGTAQSILRLFAIAACAVPIVVALPILWKRRALLFFGTYGVAGLLFLLTAVFFPPVRPYLISLAFELLCMCLPGFLCFASIRNMEAVHPVLLKLAFANFLLGVLFALFSFTGILPGESYSMSFSYYLLFPACYFVYRFHTDRKKRLLVFALLCAAFMLLLGSRGPLVTFAAYLVLSTAFSLKFNKRTVVTLAVLLAVGIVCLIFYRQILAAVYEIFRMLGIESRTLLLMKEGELFTHDSGRGNIYTLLIRKILEQPLFGYGIGGDRALRGGSYAHNLFVELFTDFGLVLGSVVVVFLLGLLLRCFWTAKNRLWFLLWGCVGFIPLMVSGSYLSEANFWLLLGLCAHILRAGKVPAFEKGRRFPHAEEKSADHHGTVSAN
ncbi:MAG TPA: O-antigen ligase family protein [Firmicutes bacterium]|nr:O-antigen ligase family protein [Bacillota bacterium]